MKIIEYQVGSIKNYWRGILYDQRYAAYRGYWSLEKDKALHIRPDDVSSELAHMIKDVLRNHYEFPLSTIRIMRAPKIK